jgi:MFS family permease
MLLWGVPLALVGIWPSTPLALVMLGVIGIGNTVVDVAALTLLQRAVADEVLARVLGVLESVMLATIALGAILAPLVINAIGIRGALIATGALLPASIALLWRRLRSVDERGVVAAPELALLREIPLFAPLPLPTLEHLARSARRSRAVPGAVVVRQGDVGDRFYVVDAGRVEVAVDGHVSGTLGPGAFFGEIALLRDVPRTATVRALEETELVTLERDDFVAAVTGYAPSAAAADAVVGARLAGVPAGI